MQQTIAWDEIVGRILGEGAGGAHSPPPPNP